MRRWSMVVLALALAGCDNLKDMFSARPEVAAEAGGQQLKVERLAKMMTSIKGVPLTRDAADFIANIFFAEIAEVFIRGRRFSRRSPAGRIERQGRAAVTQHCLPGCFALRGRTQMRAPAADRARQGYFYGYFEKRIPHLYLVPMMQRHALGLEMLELEGIGFFSSLELAPVHKRSVQASQIPDKNVRGAYFQHKMMAADGRIVFREDFIAVVRTAKDTDFVS